MAYNPNNTADETTGQARPAKPIPLPVIPDAIPSELKALDQWLIWRYFYKPDLGYWDKPPLDANKSGNLGSSTNAKTYATFDKALNSYTLGTLDGIGLGLTAQNGIVGFDLDDCRNPETGEIAPWALKIVEQVRTYWEISTSGTGLRGFGYGRKPGGRCRTGDFEMYAHGRYLCITGHHLDGTPPTIEDVQEGIDIIYAQMFPTQERQTSRNGDSPHADDTAILEALRRYKNGAKFCRLFDDGDISEYQGDHSVADQGLCALIAFRTQDPEQIDRIFQLSALNRSKWTSREDYRDKTIAKAITFRRDFYQGVSADSNGQPEDERHTSPYSDIGEDPRDQKTSARGVITLPWSDYTNATALVTAHGTDLRYCHPSKVWYAWDGKRWLADETAAVMRLATETIKAMAPDIRGMDTERAKAFLAHIKSSLSTSRLKAMVDQTSWLPGIPILPKELDQDPWLLNCLNGTLDLRTGELLPHRRTDLITMMTAAAYDPDARSIVWENFLLRILPDEADRRYVQKAAGYSLTGLGTEDVLFFPFGPTKTGKSTLLKGLRATWGDYATTADFETFLTREHVTGAPRADIAGLAGKRLVVSLEVDQGKKLAEALIKWLFGGDYVTARFLYKKEFEFLPTFKLWLASNHRPQVSSDDDAIWERIRQIPFEQTIAKEERDPGIKAEISDPEQSGAAILAWAVQGCLLWQTEGLGLPKHVEDTTDAYRKEMDPMPDFIEACLVNDDKGRVLNAAMWECYQGWSRKNRDRPKLGRKTFTHRLEQAGVDHIDSGGYRFWLGVRLRYHTTGDQEDSEKTSDEL